MLVVHINRKDGAALAAPYSTHEQDDKALEPVKFDKLCQDIGLPTVRRNEISCLSFFHLVTRFRVVAAWNSHFRITIHHSFT